MNATALATALDEQREGLLPCVHCGFCLSACPTYKRLGDEADSPRGRLHLMGAVVEGRLSPASEAFRTHIDRCLGCRACEPVCPSGVQYGSLLELARDVAARHRRPSFLTRALLGVFANPFFRRPTLMKGRVARALGLDRFLVAILPGRGVLGSARLGLAMLAASAPWKGLRKWGGGDTPPPAPPVPRRNVTVALLDGCVQDGLYRRVNDATRRVLEANGFTVVKVAGQGCCGALHAHAGSLDGARALARRNVDRFLTDGVDLVVVNAAGCGAAMKEYRHLLQHDPGYRERAGDLAARVRDATEVLAEVGPREGAAMSGSVAYDHPCHLLHAQRVEREPLRVLAAIPGLEVRVVADADECCGGAGIYGITHPELGAAIGGDKVASVRESGCEVVSTPNPGCMMQIGGGLRLAGEPLPVLHPLELLDESYRRAGYYDIASED
ncbi:MAG: heterodisulfide reductase-related iron-sulfur binding cluster [Gemmatimonadota bacterium]|nr:heterodisulfide reductase-related iron-sulfur binding cluster [Gemmatimonadota bacterium]MDH5758266.1 heterodisulfide reductase-related iron-sulfur binding cluster [Gemmatimonadota bacterium]